MFFFFFHDTATPELYTLSLHDALPIYPAELRNDAAPPARRRRLHLPAVGRVLSQRVAHRGRSEEHTSELQSRLHLVCRLLLEKKKKKIRRGQEQSTIKNTTNSNTQNTD